MTKVPVSVISTLLRGVWRIRLVEEAIAAAYGQQQMRCPVHLSIGQEAVAVAVCAALKPEDAVMSGHRAHAHYLAKGGSLQRMIAEIYGRQTGCSKGRGGSMHLIDLAVNFLGSTPIVGGTIPIATGVAWAAKMKKEPTVTVLFMGEGAAEEGVWHESVNFAVLHQLPIIFVCENNLYSVYTSLPDRQPDRPLTGIAAAHGLKTYRGDGNDAVAVYQQAIDVVEQVRSGAGPAFIELATYRWREHCGPHFDNDLGYRTVEEFEAWQKKDPLLLLQKKALKSGVINEASLAALELELLAEIAESFAFAQASPLPTADDLQLADTYAQV